MVTFTISVNASQAVTAGAALGLAYYSWLLSTPPAFKHGVDKDKRERKRAPSPPAPFPVVEPEQPTAPAPEQPTAPEPKPDVAAPDVAAPEPSPAEQPDMGFSVNQTIRQALRSFPRNVATVSVQGEERTYAEFADRVQRVGSSLRRELGLAPHARVAILSFNCVQYLELYFAAPWAGAWIVPVNIRLSPAEVALVLNDCAAEALVVDDAFAAAAPQLLEEVPSLRHVVYIGAKPKADAPEGLLHWETDLVAAAANEESGPLPALDATGSDVYGIFYTGGTTGRSKGVLTTHTNIITNAYSMISELQYDTSARYLHVAPMFHAADGTSTFAVTFAGGAHAFVPRFEPVATLTAIQDRRVTHLVLVPTMIAMVCALDNAGDFDTSSLRGLLYGASPCPEVLLLEAMALLGCGFTQGYGQTECSPINTFLTAADHKAGGKRLTSAGRPPPHVEIKVVDEAGVEVPSGVVGEVVARGPHVMKGYHGQPELTAEALRGGWMHTGDGGYMEDGYLFLCDRIKDMIITGGENVFSVEVEACIQRCPGVAMCAVIGTPDPILVEKVTAVVVPVQGAEGDDVVTQAQVRDFCHEHLGGFKVPKKVIVRSEPLPLSGAGKILKAELRKQYGAV